jgi:hypothetical protein
MSRDFSSNLLNLWNLWIFSIFGTWTNKRGGMRYLPPDTNSLPGADRELPGCRKRAETILTSSAIRASRSRRFRSFAAPLLQILG